MNKNYVPKEMQYRELRLTGEDVRRYEQNLENLKEN